MLLLIGVRTLYLYGVSSPLGPDRPLMENVTESAITGGRAQGGTFSRTAPSAPFAAESLV